MGFANNFSKLGVQSNELSQELKVECWPQESSYVVHLHFATTNAKSKILLGLEGRQTGGELFP